MNSKILNPKSKILNLATILGVFVGICLFFFALAHTTHAAILAKPPNNLGLVGYWSMNEGEGSKVGDFSGNGNHGTTTDMNIETDWVSGKRGGALDFDGTDGHVAIPHHPTLALGAEVTLATWLYPETVKEDARVLSKRQGNSRNAYAIFCDDNAGADGCFIEFRATNCGDSFTDFGTEGNSTIPIGEWSHVAVTFDDAADTVTIYINGEQTESTNTFTRDICTTNTEQLQIGGHVNHASNRWFDGPIDEVRVYNRELSASDIRGLYESGRILFGATRKDLFEENLIGHYTFDGGDMSFDASTGSTTAHDSSQTSSDGDVVGTSTNTPQEVRGVVGQALEFYGAEDGIVRTYDSFLGRSEASTEMTISAWFKRDSNGGQILKSSNCGGCADGRQFQLTHQGSSLECEIGDIDTPTIGSSGFVDGWNHVACVWEGATNSFWVYRNGEQVGTDTNGPSAISLHTGNKEVVIGREYDGAIDDIRLYEAALSANQIFELYNVGKPDLVNNSPTDSLKDGLVGYWTFDGQNTDWSTHTTDDVSGNGNDGTITNMSTTTSPIRGKIGQAFLFDGSNDEVDVGSFLSGASEISTSLWFKVEEDHVSAANPTFFGLWGEGGVDQSWRHRLDGSNRIMAQRDNQDHLDSGVSVVDGEWHHIVWTHSTAGNVSYLYLDGAQVDSDVATTLDSSTDNNVIGARDGGGNINAIIDEVRIYSRALTAEEAQRLYRIGGGR